MNSLSTYAKMNGGTFTVLKSPDFAVGTDLIDTNPSVVFYKGKYYINQRIINYTKIYSSESFNLYTNETNQLIYQGGEDDIYTSVNIVTEAATGRHWTVDFPEHSKAKYNGLEDARFVVWDDRLYMYGTRLDVYYGQGNICIYLINTDDFTVEKEWVVKNKMFGRIEKNWMAIPDKPFHFIYKPNPTTMAIVNQDDCTYALLATPSPNNLGDDVKGSTPLCRIDNNTYVALVHSNDGGFDENGRYQLKYKFKAVLYNNKLNIEKASDWFVFMNELTEFCCGVCINDGKITFTHSSFDGSSYLTEMTVEKFMDFLDEKDYKQNFFKENYVYSTAITMENSGLNAIPWFNALACMSKQTDSSHYEGAVRVLAFWARNENFVRDCIDNLHFLAYKYTKLFPDRCEAFYLLSKFESLKGDNEKAAELKSKADGLRDGAQSFIDRYLPLHYL